MSFEELLQVTSGEMPVSESDTIKVTAEEKAVYSKYGEVSITLPEVTSEK